jgi:DnaJ-domain-containing protein 1
MQDAFERLGLPRRFSIDMAALDHAYLERSRALHPDFHQMASAADQAASQSLMAAVNDAYATLSDPFRRVNHLLALAGGPDASGTKNLTGAIERRLQEVIANAGTPFDADTPPTAADRVVIRQRLNAAKTLMSLLRSDS